jgi:hypothetical protein
MKICNDCPCLNDCVENGSECKLSFKTEYTNIHDFGWATISSNCGLKWVEYVALDGKVVVWMPRTVESELAKRK